MGFELGKEATVVGRSQKDLDKYGSEGTGYLAKVVMSTGEKPVLGRKVLMDLTKPHVVLISGKRGGGKCLVGDTEITLADGSVKQIKDLAEDKNSVLALNKDFKIEEAKKTEFFSRTVDKILEINLRSGKKIKLTPEHPLFTIAGWKPAEEFSVGDRLATPRMQSVFGKEFLRESEVKILSYLIAEGHTAKKLVWFSNNDKKIVEEFSRSVKDFDEKLAVKLSSKNNYRVVKPVHEFGIIDNVRNKGKFAKGIKFKSRNSLRDRLIELGIYDLRSHDKVIPEIIFKLPKQKLSLFLNRFFSCDGSIHFDSNTKSWGVSFSSVSEKLIRQVQHLLSRFEIISILREKKVKLNGKIFPAFELNLTGKNVDIFLQEIGFFGEKELKQEAALKEMQLIKRNPNIDTIPKDIWESYRPENWAEIGRSFGYKYPKALRESIRYSPSREKLLQIAIADNSETMQKLASSDIFWDEIVSIREINEKTIVYDISVPELHNFVANDIIVHNSYTMSVIIEEFAHLPAAIRARLSVIVIDTVGIFWSLKFPNKEKNAEAMLAEWDLKPKAIDARIFVPAGKVDFYKEKKIPIDGAFNIKASELSGFEWMALFNLTWKDPEGVLLSRVVETVAEKLGTYYGIDELISAVKRDDESNEQTKQALASRLQVAKQWGLIEKTGTKITDLAKPGTINIIDVSAYRQAIGMEGSRDVIVALLGKKLFEERMLYRKEEEAKLIEGKKRESKMPVIWMLIDEAHMFMPKDVPNIALNVLLEWVRVGRQPGLSLLLATQRPNKLHPDAISQCDLFISHRMTAKSDIQAVSELRPSYLHQDFDKYYQQMPKAKGYALILDDNSEKLWSVRVRPRTTWDAGTTATAFTD